MSEQPFLFFIHIPKTAGSSFLDLIMRQCGPRFYGVYSNIHQESPFTLKQLTEFVRDHGENYDALASHRLSARFPQSVGRRNCLGVSFMRDPFDLFVSHYFYQRFHDRGFPKARELNLEDYFSYALEEGNHPHYSNWQSHVLRACEADNEGLSFDELRIMVEQDKLYLFPTSDFDTSCTLLEARHPDMFSGLWYKRKNVSQKDQKITDGLRERFAPYAEEDTALLSLAQEQSQRLSEKVFPDNAAKEAALAAFHKRNRRNSFISLPRAGLRRALTKVGKII